MAISRIAQFQEEPSRWVVQHDDRNNKILFRRLPIHEACTRYPSAELIAALLDAYPEGASSKDNQGRTPLHCAVIHGAHIDVVYLLLNACYNSILDQDFFFKVPKDYAHTTTFTHKNEVIDALTTKSKNAVSMAALGVRTCLKASHPIHGDRSGQVQAAMGYKGTAYDDHAEQLCQAMVEADTANAVRSIAIANEASAKEKIQQMKERIIGIEKQLEQETTNRERHENCVFLLEKKQETLTSALAAKDEEIKKLIDQNLKGKQQIQADAAMRGKLKKSVESLTGRLAGNDKESVEYWRAQTEELIVMNEQALQKQNSLEELLQVYTDRSRDFEEKYNSAKDQLDTTETEASEDALQSQDFKVTQLDEELAESKDENNALKIIVENYHTKLSNLEDSFYDLSDHLLKKSELLNTANEDLARVDEERVRLMQEQSNTKTRLESLEALIAEYSVDHEEMEELSKVREETHGRIKELEDLILEYDQENHVLDEKCSAYESDLEGMKKFRDIASNKIEALQQTLSSRDEKIRELEDLVMEYEQENNTLDEKYNTFEDEVNALNKYRETAEKELDSLQQHLLETEMKHNKVDQQCTLFKNQLESCKREAGEKISSLENLVKIYVQKGEHLEEYAARAKELTAKVDRLEEELTRIRMDKSRLKKELSKAYQKIETQSTSIKFFQGCPVDSTEKPMNVETSLSKAREQRFVRSSIPPRTSRYRAPIPSRIDNSDCMSVCTSVSGRSTNSVVSSCNSVASTYSTRSTDSSSSRRSASLALRTQRALKHRIPTRNVTI